MQSNTVSNADLNSFIIAAKQKTGLELGHEVGERYARIFLPTDEGGRRVFCFVDLTNGNVLRPDGWKRPNLKVRNSVQGNVYDEQKGIGSLRAGVLRL